MKIAMMTNNYKPFVGGVPISVEHLAEGLRRRGHEVWIFAPEYPDTAKEEGVIRYRSCEKKLKNGMAVPNIMDGRIRREFEVRNFDLVHVHQPMLIGNVAMHLSRKYGIPLVYTYHTRYEEYLHYIGMFSDENCQKKMRNYILLQGKRMLPGYVAAYMKRCDLVIAPSSDMRNYLYEQQIHTPVRILPTGLSDASYQKDERRAAAVRSRYLQGRTFLLCTVSRIEKEKNLYFLLRCVEKLKAAAGSIFRMMIVGDGAEKAGLEAYAVKLGIEDVVTFTGSVPNQEVKDYLYASDAFLFASKSETQGIVLAEAMAAGLPVAAVRACGINDIVRDGDNGCLTEEDEDAFAACVRRMLENPAYRKELSQGAQKTACNYKMDYIASQAETYYRMMVEREGSKEEYGYEAEKKNHAVSSILHLFKLS